MSSISRSKGNQTIKFGQLIECNMRNIFLEKSYTKCGGETSPRPFSEKWKLSISLDQLAKVSDRFFFFFVDQAEDYQNKLKLGCIALAFTLFESFLKTKSGLELVSLSYFLHNFWRKIFLLICSINWPSFIV